MNGWVFRNTDTKSLLTKVHPFRSRAYEEAVENRVIERIKNGLNIKYVIPKNVEIKYVENYTGG